MPTCVFSAADVERVAEELLAAAGHKSGYADRGAPGPALWFVHDEGVYLMSNAENYHPGVSPLAYARGCDPRNDQDWYQTARDLVGGDDFSETLAIDRRFLDEVRTAAEIRIELTEDSLSVLIAGRR